MARWRTSPPHLRFLLFSDEDPSWYGFAPILDLRLPNCDLIKSLFRMITLKQILSQLRKDAYFHIQVAPHHRRFLRFEFEGVAYQYKVLPFGLSLAPRTFTWCMDSPLWQMGIRILNYLDDWLILAQSEGVSTSHKTLLLRHLHCLGLRVNFAKSILSPSQRVLFLGTVINSVQMTATVSAEWVLTIQRHAASLKEGTARPLKAFQRMLGIMAAASPVLQLGLLHMQPIQFWLKQRVPSAAWRHGLHRVTVTRACVSALAHWRDLLLLKQGVILDTAHRRKVVSTDASNKGWGALCEGKPAFGLWSKEESGLHRLLAHC